MTSKKDAVASFIWTTGAADMVIGGVSERGSLFTLGLLTVGAGLLVRWLRQQRYAQAFAAGQGPRGRRVAGRSTWTGKAFAGRARRASALIANQFRQSNSVGPVRSRRGYSTAARPGFRANDFVKSSPARRRRSQPLQSPASTQDLAGVTPANPSFSGRSRSQSRSAIRPVPGNSPSARSDQGPPLNLPPAPRARRGRRIY